MKVTILCSDLDHPINVYITQWMIRNQYNHDITLARERTDLLGGDILFLVSCHEIIRECDRQKYCSSLVLHASDLPLGRGWSPHVWDIIYGAKKITLSLIEAEDKVDSGRIWHQSVINIPEHALWDEINELLFSAEIKTIDFAVNNFDAINPRNQSVNVEATYYRKRAPEDSEINPEKSIESQFNLLRICDPCRFPAFFNLHGERYKLTLEKVNESTD
jgi:methionyl-tRNA formyltransferase